MKKISDQAKQKAATTYNAAAEYFDHKALSFWNRFGVNTINRLSLDGGMTVLDVACGSGASALPAALTVRETGNVIAMDLAENLLDLGRSKALKLGLQNIQFIYGDMTDLEYADESFDAVICVFGIFFVPEMELLLKELWRKVKPKGSLAITTWGPNLFAPLYDVWKEEIKAIRPDLYSSFNPWVRITDVNSLINLFHSAGIKNVEVVAENGFQPLETPEDWWKIVLGSGFRWTIEKLGVEAARRVHDQNIDWIKVNNIQTIETNVIYAVSTKT